MDLVTKIYIPGVVNMTRETGGDSFFQNKDYVSVNIPEIHGGNSALGVPYGDRPVTLLTSNGNKVEKNNILYVSE
jgi:hypothetical protein